MIGKKADASAWPSWLDAREAGSGSLAPHARDSAQIAQPLSLNLAMLPSKGTTLLVPVALLCQAAAGPAQIRFQAATADSGIGFTLRNAPTERKRMIETMAGGLAVFDFDSDGLQDIYFTNGAAGESMQKESPEYSNRLFRNLGNMRFEDVTETAGVAGRGYSMGVAAADFDNDGQADLFVAGVFQNTLFRNLGDGTFEDVTARSGISSEEWAVAAGWFHYDDDGRPDLFVVNYADWTPDFDRYCGDRERGLRVYCHPKYLTPVANRLYRNLGSGQFEPIGEEVGLNEFAGRGMSAAFADFDGNGRSDVFVTNDNLPNFLFLNQDDGSFTDDALLAGAALLDHGRPVASMGVDIGDFDNDGVADLSVTALSNETFPLFRGDAGGTFRDATVSSGLAKASRAFAGWGNVFADFDNDGKLDLFTANSHVNDLVEEFEPFVYRQPNTVFRNLGERFGEALEIGSAGTHRGAAVADFDADGRLDVVVSALGEPAKLFRNVSEPRRSWLALQLVGGRSGRGALGARVRVEGQTRWVKSVAGYASSALRPVHFGLGDADRPVTVEIDWPSGQRQVVGDVPLNRITVVREPR